jgi:hypothetical protein
MGYGVGTRIGTPPPAVQSASAALPANPTVDWRPVPSEVSVEAANGEKVDSIVLAQEKRVMGRLKSLEQVRRVATEVRPLVDRALEQPEIQTDLAALARSARMSVPEYKAYFAGKQEADILLESGGDPSIRSIANAVGVAQFLASTGRRVGLKVDERRSRALTGEIDGLEREVRRLEAESDHWTRAALTGGGTWDREQWILHRQSQIDRLSAERMRVDERYDPARAIAVQTRYLLRMTRSYGNVDWALQAYHGGEGGASRTMRTFASQAPKAARDAARAGGYTLGGSGRWLPYGDVYRHMSPKDTPDAFGYVYGRSDDHRYYWWKVLMAERALDLYRENPMAFELRWEALKPGFSADVAWYPNPEPLQFADNQALRAAYQSKTLVRLPEKAQSLGIRTENLASLEPTSAEIHKGLRPEAMGALLRVAHIYKSHGGRGPLTVNSMVQSREYRRMWEARYPPAPLPPEVPRDPDYHSTGLVFDLQRPASDWDRKVLEYALGQLYDTLRLTWRSETVAGSRRYHVIVNPRYAEEMAQYYEKALR